MTRLVLLPGMDGTGKLFCGFTTALGARMAASVIAYPPTHPLGHTQLEAYVRERLPVDEPFILLGESFSGPLAISLAAGAIPNLCALILSCSFARNPRPALAGLKPLIRFLPKLGSSALASALLLGRYVTPQLRRQLDDALAPVSRQVLNARLQTVVEADASAALRRVRTPILYLRATRDRIVPPQASLEIAGLAPHTYIEAVEGPHMLLQTAPAAAAQAIVRFATNIAARQTM
jgi:pimeloyl-ACP methyl ester carboxylesterase